MNRAKQLYALQEIDLDIQRKSETLTGVTAQLGKDAEVMAARATLDAAVKHLADLERQQRTGEWEVQELSAKTAAEEKKMVGGSVKNPRELMTLQQETDALKKKRAEREDQLLAIMLDVDDAQKDVNHKRSELDAVERGWQENQQRLSHDQAALEAELVALAQKRELALHQIEREALGVYESLRQAKQGLAVARVVRGRCEGCRISLPMSVQQRARTGLELATCSNCGRILHME
jgi:predicted  nucleic acid-binding Zn-ribbon protein